MRQVAAGHDRIMETRRRLLAPGVVSRLIRQAVERGINLDRIKLGRVEVEPKCLAQRGGVEQPAPVRVGPARRADADAHPILFRSATIWAMIDSAISSGVWAFSSRPMGPLMRFTTS